MTTQLLSLNAPNGDLIDQDWFCCQTCLYESLEDRSITPTPAGEHHYGTGLGSIDWGAYPCGTETDYNVYCSNCSTLMWYGLDNDELNSVE